MLYQAQQKRARLALSNAKIQYGEPRRTRTYNPLIKSSRVASCTRAHRFAFGVLMRRLAHERGR